MVFGGGGGGGLCIFYENYFWWKYFKNTFEMPCGKHDETFNVVNYTQ